MRKKTLTAAVVTAAGLAVGTLAPLPIFAEDEARQETKSQSVTQRDRQQQESAQQDSAQQESAQQGQEGKVGESATASQPNADQQAVHDLLSKTTEALIGTGGGNEPLAQLMELVSQSDRQRLREGDQQKQARGDDLGDRSRGQGSAELEQKLRQFRQDWQAKYGSEFNLQEEQVVFSGVRIHSTAPVRSGEGRGADTATAAGEEETDAARQAGARVSPSDSGRSGSLNAERTQRTEGDGGSNDGAARQSGPVTESGRVQVGPAARKGAIPSDAKSDENAGENARANAGEKPAENAAAGDAEGAGAEAETAGGVGASGKDSLVVMIPPHRGAAEAHLRLKREGQAGWKIDVPDSMTREQLVANLDRHLGEIQQQKDNWPREETDAYKLVSHQILLALTDTALKPSLQGDGQEAGGRQTEGRESDR